MSRYLLRRTLQAVFVLWAAYTASFVLLYLLPGDPVLVMLSGQDRNAYTPQQIAAVRAQYGLDKPVPVQYVLRLAHAMRGDFGTSVQSGGKVTTMIFQALPETLKLAGCALLLAAVLGMGLGLASSYVRWRPLRHLLLSLPAGGVSLPTFWVGLILIQLVSFRWRLLPALGNQGWQSLVLPAITLALPTSAVLAQVFSRSLRAALAEPYIQTALAKGAGRARVHMRHAVRNAALPALTLAGVITGNLLAGSVVVETVFSRVGVGRITAAAVSTQDIPVVQGVVVLGAAVFVVMNLTVDLLYPLLDPRVAAVRRDGR